MDNNLIVRTKCDGTSRGMLHNEITVELQVSNGAYINDFEVTNKCPICQANQAITDAKYNLDNKIRDIETVIDHKILLSLANTNVVSQTGVSFSSQTDSTMDNRSNNLYHKNNDINQSFTDVHNKIDNVGQVNRDVALSFDLFAKYLLGDDWQKHLKDNKGKETAVITTLKNRIDSVLSQELTTRVEEAIDKADEIHSSLYNHELEGYIDMEALENRIVEKIVDRIKKRQTGSN